MSKKVQAFHNVSEAINLDSKGLHQVAFGKYLQSLQMLSNLLVEQFCAVGCQIALGNYKKEAKQLLSVISDCVERANLILNADGASKEGKKSGDSTLEKVSSPHLKPPVVSASLPPVADSIPSHYVPDISRGSVFEKVEKENAALFRKFQIRIENARDKYTRANLQLELQRRLAENLVIARSKYAQLLREQQEERRRVFEITVKNMSKIVPFNDTDRERRDLYLEVLQYEANNSQHLNVEYQYSALGPFEVVEKVLKRILQSENHPLAQWLIMTQTKLKEKLTVLVKEYSCFSEWLPKSISEIPGMTSLTKTPENIKRTLSEDKETGPIQERLDVVAQEIRNGIDTVLQILCSVYKKELPEEPETICYKLIELAVVTSIWSPFIMVCRFTSINSERRLAYTMQCCSKYNPEEFGVPSGIVIKESELLHRSSSQLKKIPMLTSVMEKLRILVQVSRTICGSPHDDSRQSEKMLGADALVPILSYVLVHTCLPQLLSECHALELLADPKYMLGEEGYSLASFQAALNYLEMKILIDPDDLESSSEKSSEETENIPATVENK